MHARTITDMEESERVSFVGQIDDAWAGISKTAKRTPYYKMIVSDETGTLKVMIFSRRKDECEQMNNGLPKKKSIVVVKGRRMDGDTIFADIIGVQENKIYTKLSEIKATA